MDDGLTKTKNMMVRAMLPSSYFLGLFILLNVWKGNNDIETFVWFFGTPKCDAKVNGV